MNGQACFSDNWAFSLLLKENMKVDDKIYPFIYPHPSFSVLGEHRFWMMSLITLLLNPISGCHPVSEKS